MIFQTVHHSDFLISYATALRKNVNAKAACTPLREVDMRGTRCYLAYVNGQAACGYAIKDTGELCYVHALIRGCGDALVQDAIANGAKRLDCFDGYLVSLYARHGFVETARVPNYTKGDPDVVYMEVSA